MHLRELRLQNFRSFSKLALELDPNLSILTGENNSGKTTVLDAVRLLTAPLDDRREIWARPEDISRGEMTDAFVISGDFTDLTDIQRGLNIAALADPSGNSFRYGFSYRRPRPGERRGKATNWAGVEGGGDPEPEARELIRHVHLPALRDAIRTLSSGSSERIALILRHLAGRDGIESLEASAKEAFDQVEGNEVIGRTSLAIQRGLTRLTEGVAAQEASLGFVDPKVERLARDLRFRLSDAGVTLGDLGESGLGYANLLYMATVIAELDAASEADLTLLLVEEPEAHLHPQLQLAVLAFLEEQARSSRARTADPARPAGHIQVIVTTHSPNVTAATSIEKTVVLTGLVRDVSIPTVPSATAAPQRATEPGQSPQPSVPSGANAEKARRAFAIPVRRLGLTTEVTAKLDRYLDVTRSSLLFSRRALLVEGISEAILLRVLGREIVLEKERAIEEGVDDATRRTIEAQNQKCRTSRSRFDATSIVPIEGVDFEPYLRLLLTAVDGARLGENVIVVTDRDPQLESDRAASMMSVAKELGAEACLSIHVGNPTLEAELLSAGNEELVRKIFLALHPKSSDRWQEDVASKPTDARGQAFVDLLKDTRTRKGEFSQEIASQIKAGAEFTVPPYLTAAIRDTAKA